MPVTIISDETRLKQVLDNLLSNSVKYSDNGEVTLTVDQDIDTQEVIFKIQDQGIGIPEDQIEDIFTVFHTVDSTNKRKVDGTGIGLSLCYNLTKLMGGTIKVTSTLGEGSTFTVRLPINYNPEFNPTNNKEQYSI